jgi:hypothetical protein
MQAECNGLVSSKSSVKSAVDFATLPPSVEIAARTHPPGKSPP